MLAWDEHQRSSGHKGKGAYSVWRPARFPSCRPQNTSEPLARDAFAFRFEGHDELAAQLFATQMFFIRREQGRLDEILEAVENRAEQHPEMPAWRYVLTYIYAALDRSPRAREGFEALVRSGLVGVLDAATEARRPKGAGTSMRVSPEEAFAGFEHDRVDHQPQFIDQVVLHQSRARADNWRR